MEMSVIGVCVWEFGAFHQPELMLLKSWNMWDDTVLLRLLFHKSQKKADSEFESVSASVTVHEEIASEASFHKR